MEVVPLSRWSYYRGGPIIEVILSLKWSYYEDDPIIEVVLLPEVHSPVIEAA